MDISTIIGFVMAFGMLMTGFILEKGTPMMLVGLSPFLIVFGGTLGALMVSFTLSEIKRIPALMADACRLHKSSLPALLEMIVKLSETARREGLLSLEQIVENPESAKSMPSMLIKGLRLIMDGTSVELVRDMLENEMELKAHARSIDAKIFDTAGGFFPTLGIIGTVMGLVLVLSNMGEPAELAKAIATAFIATLYGVVFANIVALPVGAKLKYKAAQERTEMEFVIEGVLSIQAGENPMVVRQKLETYITSHGPRKAAKEKTPAGEE